MKKSLSLAAAVAFTFSLPITGGAWAANANGAPEGHKAAKPSEGTNLSEPETTGTATGSPAKPNRQKTDHNSSPQDRAGQNYSSPGDSQPPQ